MSISYTIDGQNPTFLRFLCRGTYARDALLGVINEAIETANRMNRTAVLLDGRDIEGIPPGVFERYQLGVGAARIQRENMPLVTIAVVGNEPMIDPKRLGEIVFLNRGGVGKVFTDIDDAVAWLEDRAK